MSDPTSQPGRIRLHHLIACLGLGVLFLGLFLGWQTQSDARQVDDALLAAARVAPAADEATSLHETAILFLREARKRRLQNFSLLVVCAGFVLVLGAALMRHLGADLERWRETPDRRDSP